MKRIFWALKVGCLRRAERANAAVEFALLIPMLIVIVCGAIDFSRAFYAYVTVSSTAHEAARFSARYPGAVVPVSALQTVVAGESQGAVRLVASPASGGNATLQGPTLEGTDEQVTRVTLRYEFSPVSPIPLAGPIVISASAAAPTGGAGGVATSVPLSTPTTVPSPTPTVPPTPVAMCSVPNFSGASLNGNSARDTWTGAGFSAANFNKDENNGTVQWQTVPHSTSTATQRPCATTSITLHNHAP